MTRRRLAPWLAVIVAVALAGCATDAAPDVPAGALVVDVRTPTEFAQGHLEGAINIDVQSAEFDQRIAELDPDDDYLVYCRSGSRSAAAIDRMEDAGFEDLHDGGSLETARDMTGLPLVSN